MSKLKTIESHNCHAFVSAPGHICDELVKLHDLEFYGPKIIIIEEAKTLPRTFFNKLSKNVVANDQQSMHKMSPSYNDVTPHLQKNNIQFRTLIVHFLM